MSRWSDDYGNRRLRRKHLTPPDKHIMGKPEAKVMRRLKSMTKMSEEEIRKVKKYRKMLSDAQTNNGRNQSPQNQYNFWFIHWVLKHNNITLEHPSAKQKIREALNNKLSNDFFNEIRDIKEHEILYQMLKKTNIDLLIKRYLKYKKRFCVLN